MNLKFNEVTLDSKGLMYVEFSYGGKLLRWYPKWKDVAEVLSTTFFTESVLNNKKLTPYLKFVCLEILARECFPLARESIINIDLIVEFNKVTDKIREALFNSVTENP